MTDTTPDSNQAQKDPTQLTLPRVDTAIKYIGPFTGSDLVLFVPAALAVIAGALAYMLGLFAVAVGMIPLTAFLAFLAVAVKVSTDEWTSAREQFDDWHVHLRRSRVTPWGYEDAVENDVSGVRRFRADGTVVMQDGSVVGTARVSPTNTALLSDGEENTLAAALSSAIDEDIKGFPFRLYATTRPYHESVLADRYRDSTADAENDVQAAYLRDVATFIDGENSAAWNAREWRYYVVVTADAADVTEGANPSLFDMANPLTETDAGGPVGEEDIAAVVHDRLDTAISAFGGVTGIEAAKVGVREHSDLVQRYWTGRSRDPSPGLVERLTDRSELEQAKRVHGQEGSEDLLSLHGDTTPAERMTAPDCYDPRNGTIQVGDEYARTLWIAEWPTDPDSLFLRDLFTRRGLDLDVCLRVEPEEKRPVVTGLERDIAQVDAESMERAEEGDVTAMDVESDIDAYVKMRELLRDTPTQPWRLSAYVTVRADTVEALDEDVDTVRDSLESAPADCFPIVPGARQHEAFASGSPNRADVYRQEERVEKSTRVLGGAIGAAFPFAATDVAEPNGMDFGRNEQNGGFVRADPFERPGPPHMLTVGQSRSGKTYSASKAAARWFLEGGDRTLIVCDTQSGFDGLTQMLGGKHIVVDGRQQINPLAISPPPEYVTENAGGQLDQYRMKVDEATQFIVQLLRSQGVRDAPEYAPLISHVLEETYADHDIYPNDPDSLEHESPNLQDFIDKLVEMNQQPADYSFSEEGYEVEIRERNIGELLNKLSSFREGGKYENLVAETGSLLDDDVDMAYLDLQQVDSENDAEKSAMMAQMLSQVYEKVKRADGEVVFMIDEAHFLLKDDSMVQWLQKAAREWARYDACMWFLSQSPRDFVTVGGEKGNKDTITEQCSTIHLFNNPLADEEVFTEGYGLNRRQARFVIDEAVAGKDPERQYSECLVNVKGIAGWLQTRVKASRAEHHLLTYTPRKHGDLNAYLRQRGVLPPEADVARREYSAPEDDPDGETAATGGEAA